MNTSPSGARRVGWSAEAAAAPAAAMGRRGRIYQCQNSRDLDTRSVCPGRLQQPVDAVSEPDGPRAGLCVS